MKTVARFKKRVWIPLPEGWCPFCKSSPPCPHTKAVEYEFEGVVKRREYSE